MHRLVRALRVSVLPPAGWEDLIEEASGDLERLEGHISAATQRLVQLQAEALQAAAAAREARQEQLGVQQLAQQQRLELQQLQEQWRQGSEAVRANATRCQEMQQLLQEAEARMAALDQQTADKQQELAVQQGQVCAMLHRRIVAMLTLSFVTS
jgi:hypothetical protein